MLRIRYCCLVSRIVSSPRQKTIRTRVITLNECINESSTYLFLLLATMLSAVSAQTTNVEWKEYKGEKFRIQYPATWQPDASKTMGADLFLFTPLEGQTDDFRENVNIIIQDLTGQHIDLAKYKEITDQQLKNLANDLEVYESVLENAGGSQSYRVSYSMKQGKYHLRVISRCYIKGEKAYLATFTSEVDAFHQYAAVAVDVLKTFALLN